MSRPPYLRRIDQRRRRPWWILSVFLLAMLALQFLVGNGGGL